MRSSSQLDWRNARLLWLLSADVGALEQRLVVSQLELQLLGLLFGHFEKALELIVLLLEVAGAYRDLVLLHAALVARSLRRHVVLPATVPVLLVLELARNQLLQKKRKNVNNTEKTSSISDRFIFQIV